MDWIASKLSGWDIRRYSSPEEIQIYGERGPLCGNRSQWFIHIDELDNKEAAGEYIENGVQPTDLPDARYYSIQFNDYNILNKLLIDLADDPSVWIDTCDELIIRGSEYVERIRSEPTWDWRLE